MTKTAVGAADDDDEERIGPWAGWQMPIPPSLFRVSEIMAERTAALAQQIVGALRPQMPALEAMQAVLRSSSAVQAFSPSMLAMSQVSAELAASMSRSFRTPAWQDLVEQLGRVYVPPIGDWVPQDDAEPADETADVDLISETAERLHAAGVTAIDIDRYALLLFALRMLSLGGVVAGGVIFGGGALLASFQAFIDFLSQLHKMRQRLAELEEEDNQ